MTLLIISAADDFQGVSFFDQTIPKLIFPNIRFFGGSSIPPVKDPGAEGGHMHAFSNWKWSYTQVHVPARARGRWERGIWFRSQHFAGDLIVCWRGGITWGGQHAFRDGERPGTVGAHATKVHGHAYAAAVL